MSVITPHTQPVPPSDDGPVVADAGGGGRRGFLKLVSWLVGGISALAVLVPGGAFLLTPLLKKKGGGEGDSGAGSAEGFTAVAKFAELPVGVPKAFPVIEGRRDAWVAYPPEPIGLVWLVRQPEGAKPAVVALQAECPHLACAINLSPDGKEFFCPCHTSSFALTGKRLNEVSPRGMDALDVADFDPQDPDAVVRVRFQRFRTMTPEKIPLA